MPRRYSVLHYLACSQSPFLLLLSTFLPFPYHGVGACLKPTQAAVTHEVECQEALARMKKHWHDVNVKLSGVFALYWLSQQLGASGQRSLYEDCAGQGKELS